MAHEEFLKLVQMVDALDRVLGREVNAVIDDDVVRAGVADRRALDHAVEALASEHEEMMCAECSGIRQMRAALWETLHARGVDFAPDVWEESPMTLHNTQHVGVTDSMGSLQSGF